MNKKSLFKFAYNMKEFMNDKRIQTNIFFFRDLPWANFNQSAGPVGPWAVVWTAWLKRLMRFPSANLIIPVRPHLGSLERMVRAGLIFRSLSFLTGLDFSCRVKNQDCGNLKELLSANDCHYVVKHMSGCVCTTPDIVRKPK